MAPMVESLQVAAKRTQTTTTNRIALVDGLLAVALAAELIKRQSGKLGFH
jgi:hypothetical protein